MMAIPTDRSHGSSPAGHLSSRRRVLGRLGAGLTVGVSLGLANSSPLAAQDSTPTGDQPAFFEQWLAVWTQDPGQVDALYAEDAVLEDVAAGATFQGRVEIRGHIEAELAAFSDPGYEVRSIFTAGNWAAAEFVFSGVYSGSFPGLPPGSGQPVTLAGVAIFELGRDLIRRESHYYDAYGLLVQLGVLPAPGTEEEREGTPTP